MYLYPCAHRQHLWVSAQPSAAIPGLFGQLSRGWHPRHLQNPLHAHRVLNQLGLDSVLEPQPAQSSAQNPHTSAAAPLAASPAGPIAMAPSGMAWTAVRKMRRMKVGEHIGSAQPGWGWGRSGDPCSRRGLFPSLEAPALGITCSSSWRALGSLAWPAAGAAWGLSWHWQHRHRPARGPPAHPGWESFCLPLSQDMGRNQHQQTPCTGL